MTTIYLSLSAQVAISTFFMKSPLDRQRDKMTKWQRDKQTKRHRDRESGPATKYFSISGFHYFLPLNIIAGHNFLTKLFRLISSLNSVEYEIGFRLEEFFFSVFFFIIHLLRKLNLRSYGRWSSLFSLQRRNSDNFSDLSWTKSERLGYIESFRTI